MLMIALGCAFLLIWKSEKSPVMAYVYLLAAIFSFGFAALGV